MARLDINIGASANDKSGDTLRVAFNKVNLNFAELFSADINSKYYLGDDTQFVSIELDGEGVPTGGITVQSGFDTSMPVYIKGGNALQDGVGGNVVIEAGAPPLATTEQLIQGAGPYAGTVGNIEMSANQTTIESLGNTWTFRDDGILELPAGGDIYDSEGNTVLGSGGISISDFGEGFGLDNADKIVTNKLYSTNLTQPTQHYRLELDTNGVVHLPDQSIINGATLKSVAGNYAGITAGPVGKDEDSWVWVDDSGTWIATDYSTNAYQWHFGNDGGLTFPNNSIFDGQTLTDHATGANYTLKIANGGVAGSKFGIGTGSASFGVANDALNHAEDGYVPYSVTASRINLTVLGAGSWVFGGDGKIELPNTGTIANTLNDGGPVGTIFTFTGEFNSVAPDLVEDNRISLVNNSDTQSITPGWIITFANSSQKTVTASSGGPGSWDLDWSGNLTLSSADVWPLTIQSADYSTGSTAKSLEITPDGTTTWTFGDDGNLSLPAGGDILDSNGDTVLGTGVVRFSNNIIYTAQGQVLFISPSNDGHNQIIIPSTGEGGDFPLTLTNGDGNVVIQTGSSGNQWNFDQYGILNLPLSINGKGVIQTNGDYYFSADGAIYNLGADGILTLPDGTTMGAVEGEGTFGFYSGTNNFLLEFADNITWSFNGSNGNLTLPDATVQTTAYPGSKNVTHNTVLAGPAQARDYAYQNDGSSLAGWTVEVNLGSITIDGTQGNPGSSIKVDHANNNFHANFGGTWQNRTIEFDVMFDTDGDMGMNFGTDSGGGSGISLRLRQGVGGISAGLVSSLNYLYTDNGTDTCVFTAMTWYTVKVVIGDGSLGSISYYIDGALKGTNTSCTLGSNSYWGFLANSGTFWIDNIKVYREILTSAPSFRALVAADLPEINVNTLTGTTLASNVTDSSLTSVGHLTNLVVAGTVDINSTEDSINADTGALQVSGGATIGKNLIAIGTIYAGQDSYSEALTNPLIVASSPANVEGGYSQVAILNNTAEASGDFQVFVDGYDVNISDTGWSDLGYAGSNFNDERYTITNPGDGYVFVSGLDGSTNGGSLVLATDGSGTTNDIVFATGGFTTANEKMRLSNADGSLTIPGEIKTAAGVGDVVIESNNGTAHTWTFGANGRLTLPEYNTFISQYDGETTFDGGTDDIGVQVNVDKTIYFRVGTNEWALGAGAGGANILKLPEGGDIVDSTGTSVFASTYTLPTASDTVLGGVKVDGSTIVIDGSGVISSTVVGAVTLKGTWDASTNTPTLSSSLPAGVALGWQYLVSVTGTIDIGDGSQTYTAGDIVMYDGTTWVDIPGAAGSVASFNNRTGAVSLTSGDVTTALGFTPYNATNPSGYITSSALSSYATQTYVTSQGYITSSGNAATATKLASSVTINNVAFDGSGNITVTAAAGTLTGATLNANVTGSSLTSVGTLTNLTVTNPITGSVTGSAGSVAASALTGNTLASGVTSSSLTSVGTLTNLTVTNTITGSVSGNAGTVTNGVYTTDTGTVTNTMLSGSIANSKLANSSITVNGTSISLGGSATISASLPVDTLVNLNTGSPLQITNSMYRILITAGSSSSYTFTLPDTNTCTVGQSFVLASAQTVTQNYGYTIALFGGGSSGQTWTAGTNIVATCVAQRGGSAEATANWKYSYQGGVNITGTGAQVLAVAPSISGATLTGAVDMNGGYTLLGQVGEKFSTWPYTIGGVTATPSAVSSGVFTIPNTTGISLGQAVTITGTNTGTGSISGYVSGTTYYVISTAAASGASSVTLSASRNSGGVVATTPGTLVGLTMTFGAHIGVNPYGGLGHIVNVTGTINANFDVCFQSVNQTQAAYSLTLIINQGATPYMINNFYTGSYSSYAGNAQTINWANGIAPTGTANKKDVITLSWIPSTQYAATVVLGQVQSFG